MEQHDIRAEEPIAKAEAEESVAGSQDGMFAELDAMRTVAKALASLEIPARARVLRWAMDSSGVDASKSPSRASIHPDREEKPVGPELTEYSDLADLFSAANPRTDAQKVLVAAYWHQFHEEREDVDSLSVNQDLKNLGHRIGNVTRAFDALITQRPQPVVQTRKSGSSKQARKRYRLTAVGKDRVKEMVNDSAE